MSTTTKLAAGSRFPEMRLAQAGGGEISLGETG